MFQILWSECDVSMYFFFSPFVVFSSFLQNFPWTTPFFSRCPSPAISSHFQFSSFIFVSFFPSIFYIISTFLILILQPFPSYCFYPSLFYSSFPLSFSHCSSFLLSLSLFYSSFLLSLLLTSSSPFHLFSSHHLLMDFRDSARSFLKNNSVTNNRIRTSVS